VHRAVLEAFHDKQRSYVDQRFEDEVSGVTLLKDVISKARMCLVEGSNEDFV
jgi:hypothetical protein